MIRTPLLKNPFRRQQKISFLVENNETNPGGIIKVVALQPWNDIPFESRNKDYGAYNIRKSDGSNILFGFSVVLLISFIIVVWWWIQFKTVMPQHLN